jgi:hypothetical protein
MDHDEDSGVEMVVVDQMDGVMVILYPRKSVISKNKIHKFEKNLFFPFIDIQISCDLPVSLPSSS